MGSPLLATSHKRLPATRVERVFPPHASLNSSLQSAFAMEIAVHTVMTELGEASRGSAGLPCFSDDSVARSLTLCLLYGLSLLQLTEKNRRVVNNYGVWIRYNSRSGTHNMYKEYRDVTLCKAVEQMYSELAGRHRARPRSIQIMRTAIVAAKDTKKTNVQQFHDSKIQFPLSHRLPRAAEKHHRTVFKASRPCTFRG
ncbi:hypothetical protein BBJ28_00021942 [Nothophytophthora sp. Chile5]|nr:hypothetical protein BBJ28_00021942 [Nothophytophthora sp. Chile5]